MLIINADHKLGVDVVASTTAYPGRSLQTEQSSRPDVSVASVQHESVTYVSE